MPFGNLHCNRAEDAADLALEITHAGFTRVAVDDVFERLVVELQLVFADAVLDELFRDEVVLRDRELLDHRVAG